MIQIMKIKMITASLVFLSATYGYGQDAPHVVEPPKPVSWGAFVDTYYAYDFNQPQSIDRAYTTQPARHNEFNVNLAYIEGNLHADKVHGRLALQAGTSVQSNYSGEPTVGNISGGDLSRHIQEAYAGYHITDNTWIDAGIMFSHMGLESFISKDNLTYTRSLVADYSPYYQAGVRLNTTWNEKLSTQLLLINGWQNISENNGGKAAGTQVSYNVTPKFSITYNTFFGKEISFRQFHDFIFKFTPNGMWNFAFQTDVGFQNQTTTVDDRWWYGLTAIAKAQVSKMVGIVGRFERYADPDQVIILTGSPNGFKAWGASFGVDTTLYNGVMWRNEFRALWSSARLFPSQGGDESHDYVAVTALTAAF